MPSTWYTTVTSDGDTDPIAVARAVAAWDGRDAPEENLEVFEMILDVAKEQVLEFGPAAPDGGDYAANPPARFVYAQLKQAQNLWNAGRATPDVGPDGFSFQPRPLDKTIRGIIRPTNGKPSVF